MGRFSYHTHTTISDGKLSPRELIEEAISLGYEVLAITDHYPRPEGIDSTGWSSDFYTDDDYGELCKLQKEYKGKIKILVGVEFEWYSKKKDWISYETKRRDYDIRLVSAHQLFVNGKYYTINSSPEAFESSLDAFGGDVKALIRNYYGLLRDAVKSGLFDIVAHFDLVKTFNQGSKYFSEDEEWYREEVIQTLDLIKKSKMKMEVNLQRFIREGDEQWPSSWIIDLARERDIELVISTDAHDSEGLAYNLSKVEKIMS